MGSTGDASKGEGRLHLVLSWSTKDETGGLDLGEHREKRRSVQSVWFSDRCVTFE